MTDQEIAISKLPRAKAGSKEGYGTVSGQVRPDVFEAFRLILSIRKIKQTDAVDEAIALYVEQKRAA